MRTILAALVLTALAAPALADIYPVSGRWGESTSSEKGPIDCSRLRVISFNGDTRTDSKGGVPAYRNVSVTSYGSSGWRVIDIFTTGQIRNGTVSYTLVRSDPEHVVLNLEKGGSIKLRRCK